MDKYLKKKESIANPKDSLMNEENENKTSKETPKKSLKLS